tara:strand:+ start:784 stop:2430 length:1647 start_codon:yes stop_codon:yes gene_type:complete
MIIKPSVIPENLKSKAEERLFFKFKSTNISNSEICFHSLRLPFHKYKEIGEIDFLYFSRTVLIVLEVKGGGVSVDEDGVWHSIDRFGHQNRLSESPFMQAQGNMYSLMDKIEKKIGADLKKKLLYGFGVMFPDISFEVESVEWDEDMIFDSSDYDTASGLEKYIKNLIFFWKKKVRAGTKQKIRDDEFSELSDYFRSRFDLVPNLHAKATEINFQQEKLTKEQYKKFDIIEDNPRILCHGGAGTGKTFIAAELARRNGAEGKRVAFACNNPLLINHLKARIEVPNIELLDTNIIRETNFGKNFDLLIVDEAQDLMTMDMLECLDVILSGGLHKGKWNIFFDPNNQITKSSSFEEDAMQYIDSIDHVAVTLQENCRNTGEIVVQTRLITLADLGVPFFSKGPHVEYHYYSSREDGASQLRRIIEGLFNNSVSSQDITILSDVEFEDSLARLLPSNLRQYIYSISLDKDQSVDNKKLDFCTPEDFKGLENRFIIITDMSQNGNEIHTAEFYVSMTRARVGLYMILPKTIEKEINNLCITNSNLAKSYENR